MKFLGFLVMENRLKPESKGTIENLRKADIDVVMATGDNILTAVSISRQCGIVDEKIEVW